MIRRENGSLVIATRRLPSILSQSRYVKRKGGELQKTIYLLVMGEDGHRLVGQIGAFVQFSFYKGGLPLVEGGVEWDHSHWNENRP